MITDPTMVLQAPTRQTRTGSPVGSILRLTSSHVLTKLLRHRHCSIRIVTGAHRGCILQPGPLQLHRRRFRQRWLPTIHPSTLRTDCCQRKDARRDAVRCSCRSWRPARPVVHLHFVSSFLCSFRAEGLDIGGPAL